MAPLAPEIPTITLIDILAAVPFAEQNSSFFLPMGKPGSYNFRSVCRSHRTQEKRGRHQAGSYHGARRREAKACPRAVETHLPRRREGQPAACAAARQRRVCSCTEPSGGYRKQRNRADDFPVVLAVRDLPVKYGRGVGLVRCAHRTASRGGGADASQRNPRGGVRTHRESRSEEHTSELQSRQ